MKNKIKFIFCATCIVGTISVFMSREGEPASDSLTLMNIEALAGGESNYTCVGEGSVDCPVNHVKVFFYR